MAHSLGSLRRSHTDEPEVFYDREVLKEEIEEVYVDKYVERVVEILREV